MGKNGIGITKIMLGLTGIFLAIVIIGLLMSPVIAQNMKNTNYGFSDASELIMFGQMLNENEIPFRQISSNVVSVEPEWEDEADNVYQIILGIPESKVSA